MNPTNCWNCGQPSAESLFCKYCNTLQPPVPDYYRFLGLERKLSLDPGRLQKLFYEMSRKLHPDLMSRADPREREHSLEASAILNDAYRTLRDPVTRAEYVLKEEGLDTGSTKPKNPPPELLEEVFDLNMAIEEFRGGDASVRPQLEQARARFLALRAQADEELEGLFVEYDRARERRVLEAVRDLLARRRYISNLLGEVDKELAA